MNALSTVKGRVVGGTLAVVAGLVFMANPASAQEAVEDPTGGATTTLVDQLTAWIGEYGAPMLVALLLIGVTLGVFMRFSKRGAKST